MCFFKKIYIALVCEDQSRNLIELLCIERSLEGAGGSTRHRKIYVNS